MAKTYKVKKGDSLWKIAKENNLSLDELIKLNPTKKDMIHPDDELRLAPDRITYDVNIRQERQNEDRLNLENITAIQGYKHSTNYAIIDKKNHTFSIFDKDNNLLYQTDDIATGASGNDYNTVTYRGKRGTIENMAGNNSTPAGITQITGISNYHGAPAFTRGRVNNNNQVGKVRGWQRDDQGNWYQTDNLVNDDIASSLHIGNTKTGSNGCVRLNKQTLEDIGQFLGVGDRVYTLPEQGGSRFTLKGGKLNFTADNPYGNIKKGTISESGHDMENWDDYNTTIDKTYTPLKLKWKKTGNKEYDNNRKSFARGIVNNQEALQKMFNLSSSEYNHLAELALGIAEQESKFGTATRYKVKQLLGEDGVEILKTYKNAPDIVKLNPASALGYTITKYNVDKYFNKQPALSRGWTQIKNQGDNEDLRNIYKQLGIDDNSIKTGEGSAIATIARLAYMYNNEVKGRNFTNSSGVTINPYHALLYKWNGHGSRLTDGTATPENNEYIRNVNRYSRNFDLYETRTYNQYKLGGRVNLKDINNF